MNPIFLAVCRLIVVGAACFACWGGGVRHGADQAHAKVVMVTKVFACGRYIGTFLVTGDGHWLWQSVDALPEKAADLAQTKVPPYAAATLNTGDPNEGDCPPHIKTQWRNP